ncbi:Hint domain-containing protein [Labrys okinawensis]|uniref:Hint domain-containing protein n=1 Tax=Labrys okinawensis TaxID=346911 RepID=UPI0039BCD1CC
MATDGKGNSVTGGAGTQANPYILSSGLSNPTLEAGAYYTLPASSTLSGVVINGAHLTVSQGSTVTGAVDFSGTTGSSLTILDDSSHVAQLTQNGSQSSSGLKGPASMAGAYLKNFGASDTVSLPNVSSTGTYSINEATSTATSSIARGTIYLNTDGQFGLAVQNGGQTYTFTNGTIIGCFLRGTLISTRDGEVAVEDLNIGDEVATVVNGQAVYRRITWIGSGHVDAGQYDFDPVVYPVRIKAGAFAPNMPQRDLLLTQEHCIFVDGKLIPARMLVNRQSIMIDRSIPQYEYFHIQLEEHAILMSEGLMTESYLNGSNRETFDNRASAPEVDGAVVLAAPLAVDRATVEPIWHRLYAYAREAGLAPMDWWVRLGQDSQLRVQLDDGEEIQPQEGNEGCEIFHIPEGRKPVRLLSNASMPCNAIGPFVDDRRLLGVAVNEIEWLNNGSTKIVTAADLNLPGWYEQEEAQRWTSADAALDLPSAESGDTTLVIKIGARMQIASGVIEMKAA